VGPHLDPLPEGEEGAQRQVRVGSCCRDIANSSVTPFIRWLVGKALHALFIGRLLAKWQICLDTGDIRIVDARSLTEVAFALCSLG